MNKVTLPGTDLHVTQLCFGCWGLTTDFHWGERDDSESVAAVHAAVDVGVNFFDTAQAYANGESEQLLGKALGSKRKNVVVASKVMPDDSMKPQNLAAACDATLERLGTDYLDLYQIHWSRDDLSMQDVWGEMLKLRDAGKARYVGVCNFGLGNFQEIGDAAEFPVTNQIPYNLLWRMIETDILPFCEKKKMGVLAYSPLMHGLLAGKYATAADVPDGRARSRHFSTERELARHGEAGQEAATFAAIKNISGICKEIGRSMADVSLAYVAQQPAIHCVIAGVKNVEQLHQNLDTLGNPLSPDTISALEGATAELKDLLGPNPDMWQGDAKSRYH
jgi:aryl-alcohol dehydrogenase-like predicted oxidoreductase